jgi:predicted enzyme related to lactoylglutathione lyase
MTSSAPTTTFVSIRVITDDVARLAGFYEAVTGTSVHWLSPEFAQVETPTATLAIGSSRTVAMLAPGTAVPATNRSVLIEFLVDDVDAEHARIAQITDDVVAEPTTMPRGNRSLLFRDPDGNLVNFFTPVTPDARARFGR